MKKTLLAVAVALAYSVTPAWADRPGPDPKSDPSLEIGVKVHDVTVDVGDKTATVTNGNGNSAATSNGKIGNTALDSFNTSEAITRTKLRGTVTYNTVANIGNTASNEGAANGGSGGDGGSGGNGGNGGNGGGIGVGTGYVTMANKMDGTAQTATGITKLSQNSAANSMVQQGVNVQANLSVGTGSTGVR